MTDRLTLAAAELQRRIDQRQPMRCMGCDRLRQWPPTDLLVVIYEPRDPAHWPLAYCACRACLSDPARLARWAETASRAAGEGDHVMRCR
ncbi:MAG: hypothetical protein ACP5RV_12250 [Thiomonas sp.]